MNGLLQNVDDHRCRGGPCNKQKSLLVTTKCFASNSFVWGLRLRHSPTAAAGALATGRKACWLPPSGLNYFFFSLKQAWFGIKIIKPKCFASNSFVGGLRLRHSPTAAAGALATGRKACWLPPSASLQIVLYGD